MQNYLDGMAKADYTIQRTTEEPQKYLAYFGSRVKRGDKTYMITNIALRNRNFQYDVFFQLNENHIRKNMCYLAPQTIRANMAIQYSNIQNRQTHIRDNMVCSLNYPDAAEGVNIKYLQNSARKAVFNVLLPHSPVTADLSENLYPQFANIINDQQGDDVLSSEESSTNIAPFLVGNDICFNIKFLNNAISGKSKEGVVIEENGAAVRFGRVSAQIPNLYTNSLGEVYKTSISLISVKDKRPEIGEYKTKSAFDKAVSFVRSAGNVYAYNLQKDRTIIEIPKLNLQKDMIEEYNITYSLNVKGSKLITVYPEMLKYSRLINQTVVCEKLHAIAYDDYDGRGNVIGESDIDRSKVTLGDYTYKISRTIDAPINNENPKSLLLQSYVDKKWINCMLINNDNYQFNLVDNLTINF